MPDRFRRFAVLLLAASVVSAGWLLAHPEPPPPADAPAPAGREGVPSIDPIAALVAGGRGADAITALAAMVRDVPEIADKGGPLASSPALRDLVLTGWKGVVASSGDPTGRLVRDVRFLQRRLAGGCS